MTLGCKVDNVINLILLHKRKHGVKVADVRLNKGVVWLVFYILEICKVTRVSELVKVDDSVVRVFVYKETNYVAANETSTASYDITFPITSLALLNNGA